MKKKEREQIRAYISILRTMANELEEMAIEVEAHIMRVTTMDSPEWHGRANR